MIALNIILLVGLFYYIWRERKPFVFFLRKNEVTTEQIVVIFIFIFSIYLFFAAELLKNPTEVFFILLSLFSTLWLLSGLNSSYRDQELGINKAMGALRSMLPETARVLRNWSVEDVKIASLKKNDLVIVRAGEVVSADGQISIGSTSVDESQLTGESLPIEKPQGSLVLAGSANKSGNLQVKLLTDSSEFFLLKNIQYIRNLPIKNFSKILFTANFLVFYEILAVLLYGVLIFIFSDWVLDTVLHPVSILFFFLNPIFLLLAIRLLQEFFKTKFSDKGIDVKAVYLLELINKCKYIIFNKTGTLTLGRPFVSDFKLIPSRVRSYSQEEILRISYHLALRSAHPNSEAVVKYITSKKVPISDELPISGYQIHENKGVSGTIGEDVEVLMGNHLILEQFFVYLSAKVRELAENIHKNSGKVVYIAVRREIVGIFSVSDSSRSEVSDIIDFLTKAGRKVVLMTGDNKAVAEEVANKLGISTVYSGLDAFQKGAKILDMQSQGEKVLEIGNAANDSISLLQADVSVSMLDGAPAAKESSDIVLLNNKLISLIHLFELSFKYERLSEYLLFGLGAGQILLVLSIVFLN